MVPVDAESWSRDPFGGDLVDGVVWGRGAVDMKDMVAMELGVMLALQRSGAELRRDVIFAAVADEEAGGKHGARGLVDARPELFVDADGRPAAAALNEVGGYSMTLGGRRFYTIQVAEKGIVWTRLRTTGTPGHGSMPHDDNATVKLAAAVSGPGRGPGAARAARSCLRSSPASSPPSAWGRSRALPRPIRPPQRPRWPPPSTTRSCAARSTPCCATRSRRRCFTPARR